MNHISGKQCGARYSEVWTLILSLSRLHTFTTGHKTICLKSRAVQFLSPDVFEIP